MKSFLVFFMLVCISLGALAFSKRVDSETVTITAQVNTSGSGSGGSGGGGGGGGGGGSGNSGTAEAIFKGTAYPGSLVTLLKDGEAIAEIPASPDANFEISLSGMSSGRYIFVLVARDENGITSVTRTFKVTLSSGVTALITGIFIPPTIGLDKSEVKRGDVVTFYGQTSPASQVNLVIHSDTELVKKVAASQTGSWLYRLDSLELEFGDHSARARSSQKGDVTDYSKILAFKVGTTTTSGEAPSSKKSDFNNDGHVNLVDFSIAAFWYKRPLAAEAKHLDLNADGVVNLVDFSIMAYNWTG